MSLEVALYLRNEGVEDVDLRHPEQGNPGIGGTQFGFVSLAHYLTEYCIDEVVPVLYAQSTDRLPDSVTVRPADDILDVVRSAAVDDCDMLLVRLRDSDLEKGVYDVAEEVGLPIIVWAQNFPTLQQLDAAANHSIVKRIVCVGREELDRHRDHPVFEKSTYVYNGIDPDLYSPETHEPGEGTTVVYLGALIQAKGFHRLARVWPEVEERIPSANLVVIGTGKLYSRDTEVGEWGVAAEEYERTFRPYLASDDGGPRSSVEFKGNMGTEKIPILQEADVGVPNPTGFTETFCWTGVEFQAAGTPVVTAAEGGLLDTVRDEETGLLINDDDELADAIVHLLRDQQEREKFGRAGMQFVERTFGYESIIGEWRDLFVDVAHGHSSSVEPMKRNFFYQDKWLKELMRRAKKRIPRLQAIPPLFALPGKRALFKQAAARLLDIR